MEKIVCRYALLYYPNFSEEFIIHRDDSKTQLGGLIIQNDKLIALYSRNLNPTEINYITIEG